MWFSITSGSAARKGEASTRLGFTDTYPSRKQQPAALAALIETFRLVLARDLLTLRRLRGHVRLFGV